MEEITTHPGKVLLAFPSNGHDISPRWLRSFVEMKIYDAERAVAMWAELGCPEDVPPFALELFCNYVCVETTSNLAKARNRLVVEFLTNEAYAEAEWLLFLDTDMEYPPDLLLRLVGRARQFDLKILGGLCVIVTEKGPLPTLFVHDDRSLTRIMFDYPDDTVAQVAATGTGCLMVHRSVFEEMQATAGGSENAWFGYDVRTSKEGVEWAVGEDVSFCLRAAEAGHKTHVDTSLPVGHHKGVRVWYPADCRTSPVSPDDLPEALAQENVRA